MGMCATTATGTQGLINHLSPKPTTTQHKEPTPRANKAARTSSRAVCAADSVRRSSVSSTTTEAKPSTAASIEGLAATNPDDPPKASAVRQCSALKSSATTTTSNKRSKPSEPEAPKDATATLTALRAKRAKPFELYYADRVTPEAFEEHERRITTQLHKLEGAQHEDEQRQADRDELAARFEEVGELLASIDIDDVLEEADDLERRILIEDLIEADYIYPDHLRVVACGAPPLRVELTEVGLRPAAGMRTLVSEGDLNAAVSGDSAYPCVPIRAGQSGFPRRSRVGPHPSEPPCFIAFDDKDRGVGGRNRGRPSRQASDPLRYAGTAGKTTREPSLSRAISIATSVGRSSAVTPSPSSWIWCAARIRRSTSRDVKTGARRP